MEEDIKKINDYIHDWYDNSTDEDGYDRHIIDEDDKNFINAIENILNRLQEDEAVIKEMVKSIHNDNDIEYEVCEHAHELSIECDGYSRETKEHCEKCIENYFRKKVQDERNKV